MARPCWHWKVASCWALKAMLCVRNCRPWSTTARKLVLNMNNIEYIDSAELGTLIEVHLNAKSQGASLKLCHLRSKLQEVLQITRLATVFQVCNTEAGAVASFSV